MVISDRSKCIFVHIQKTAGTSVARALTRGDPTQRLDGRGRHRFAREIRAAVSADIWASYFKFAFVRNPWDRLVSWYHMCMNSRKDNPFVTHVQENAPTFRDFITGTTTGIAERTTYNQLDYLTDEKGELLVDFVGRYETLDGDFAKVAAKLGLSSTLPRTNISSHHPYRDYYTDETMQIVAERFARDIHYFGYKF